MIERIYKKSLILGIVVLFIGASIVPSISGYSGKTSAQITNGDPVSFLMSDDYVNAYWKFDEGNGNTAHDSSNHNYDGTIYGATWTTDTPSGSGYALNFDGLDDYVDFDNYAEYYLGFNKTDDAIFSFHFKTSSKDKGVIYSSCRGDAYGYNPGFHIALNPNGTIEVQVWRLNCGILMSSIDSYTNGVWHEVEIFYNGITTNPYVEIYVDGNLDSTYDKYVCFFYSDNFKYTQMGRNSHELTDYFDGKVDEFKFIKYPGGNKQDPPTIDGPTYGDAGIEYDYTFVSDDPEGDEWWLRVDWDDGTYEEWDGPYDSGGAVTKSHTWSRDGLYNVKAKSRDRWDDSWWSEEYPVRIGNWPPDAPEISGPKSGKKNQVLTYTFVSEDHEGEDIFYYIEWGDDSVDDWFGPFPSGQEVTASHQYGTEEIFEIRAKAKDINDEEGPEGTLIVTMPRNKLTSNIFILWLLEQFQFLEKLFNLL